MQASMQSNRNSAFDIRKIVLTRVAGQGFERSTTISSSQTNTQSAAYGIHHNVLRHQNYQAVILHTSRDEMLDFIDENYPLALVCVVNKPIISYQIEYLERYGINNIMITVERKYASKVERYLKNCYTPVSSSDSLNIELVVFQEEEEPMTVLR